MSKYENLFRKNKNQENELRAAMSRIKKRGNDPEVIALLDAACKKHLVVGNKHYSFLDSVREYYRRYGKISAKQLYWVRRLCS